MIFRDLIFQTKVVEQRLRARVISHHDQQPSEDCREHRHRELWPAYNLNLAPPQASTEGLFQHSQDLSLIISYFSFFSTRTQPESVQTSVITPHCTFAVVGLATPFQSQPER